MERGINAAQAARENHGRSLELLGAATRANPDHVFSIATAMVSKAQEQGMMLFHHYFKIDLKIVA